MNSSGRSDANDSEYQEAAAVGGRSDGLEVNDHDLILQNFFRNPNNYLNNIPSSRAPPNNQAITYPQNNEADNQKPSQKTPQEALVNVIRNNLIIQIVFLTTILHFAWQTPFWLVFSIVWIYDISVIKNSINDMRASESKEVRRLCAISICEYISFILLKVAYSFCIMTSALPYVLPVCIMVGLQVGKIVLIILLKFKEEKPLLRESGETCFKMFILIQILLVGLKIDRILSWSWKEVFWIYWVFFSVMLGINIGFVIILLGKLYQKCHSNIKSYRIKGVFWVCFLVTGITVNSCLFVTSTIEYLQEKATSKLIICLAFIALFIILLVGFTAMFYNDILIFFERIDVDEDEDEEDEVIGNLHDEYQSYNNQNENREMNPVPRNDIEGGNFKKRQKKKKKIKKKKMLPESIPMLLTKFSSTYYKVSSMLTPAPVEKQKKKRQKGSGKQNNEVVYTEPTYTPSQIMMSSRSNGKYKNVSNSQMEFQKYLNQLKIGQESTTFREKCYEFNTKMLPTSEYMTSCSDRRAMEDPSELTGIASHRSESKLLEKGTSNQISGGKASNFPIRQKSDEVERSVILEIKDDSSIFEKPPKLRRNHSDPTIRNLTNKETSETGTNALIRRKDSLSSATPNPKDTSVLACLICFDKAPDAVFLDCGHGGLCYACSLEIMEKTGECYLCRSKIKEVLQFLQDEGMKYKVIESARVESLADNDVSKSFSSQLV